MKSVTRYALILGGSVSVGLGIVGIFLPLLPTTPFLLLGAFCYARSSQTLYERLLNARYVGAYLRRWREGRGIPLGTKILALSLLWGTIGYSVVAVVPLLAVRLLLVAIAVGVTVHLVRMPTYRE